MKIPTFLMKIPAVNKYVVPAIVESFGLVEWLQSGVRHTPLSPAVHQDPYPQYHRLREKDPVHWSPLLVGWVLTRYEDIDNVLRDWKRFENSDEAVGRFEPEFRPFLEDPLPMLFSNPPDHTRLRSLVAQAFTPRSIKSMEPRIREIVDDLLDQIDISKPVDIIDAFAYPLPVIVIAEMLGIPSEDRVKFREWSSSIARILEPTTTTELFYEAAKSGEELRLYFKDLIAKRRESPGDDLMSVMIAAEEGGDSLTEEELLVTMRLLLVAGNETTTNLISNGLLALLEDSEAFERLRKDHNLLGSAVDELLRFDSPVQIDRRTALEDVLIGGKTIKKGQPLLLLLGAANRDPAQFVNPDYLNFDRDETSHIAFGRGIHHCLGAPLARVEAMIAFEALLDRYEEIELQGNRPKFKDHAVLRGMYEMTVRVEAK
jgi:hypothetical protein